MTVQNITLMFNCGIVIKENNQNKESDLHLKIILTYCPILRLKMHCKVDDLFVARIYSLEVDRPDPFYSK